MYNLVITVAIFISLHVFVWFSANSQLVISDPVRAFTLALLLGVPASALSFMSTKYGYQYFESLWSVRMLGFGTSYLVFPVLTWVFIGESPFTLKTVLCVLLSILILIIQVFV